MKNQLISLAKKLTAFHGKMATSEQARNWRNFAALAILAAVLASFAGEWKAVIKESPARPNRKNKMLPGLPDGTEVTVLRESYRHGFLVKVNGQEVWLRPQSAKMSADVVALPNGGYTPPQIPNGKGGFYTHDELYQLQQHFWIVRGDSSIKVPLEPGHPFSPLPGGKDGEAAGVAELEVATLLKWEAPPENFVEGKKENWVAMGPNSGGKIRPLAITETEVIACRNIGLDPMLAKFPKEAFKEFGGTDKKEIVAQAWNWPPLIPKPADWDEKTAKRRAEKEASLRKQAFGEAAPNPGTINKKTRFSRVFPYSPKEEFTLARGLIIECTRELKKLEVAPGTKVRILASYEASPKSVAERINSGPQSPITRHIILVGESKEQVLVPASIIAEHGGQPGEPLRVDSLQAPESKSLFRKDGPQGFIWTGLPTGEENVPSSNPEGEKAVFAKINGLRASKGLPPLTWNEDLARAARYQAGDCYVQGYSLGHQTLDKIQTGDKDQWGTQEWEPDVMTALRFSPLAKGQNWGGDFADFIGKPEGAERAFNGWLKSPPHYQLMLNPACSTVGVGNVGSMWVTVFGD